MKFAFKSPQLMFLLQDFYFMNLHLTIASFVEMHVTLFFLTLTLLQNCQSSYFQCL